MMPKLRKQAYDLARFYLERELTTTEIAHVDESLFKITRYQNRETGKLVAWLKKRKKETDGPLEN